MSLFGGPFFLAGVFLAFTTAGIVPMGNFPTQIWARPLMVLMSLAFLVVGGVLVFGRRWLTLDTGAGRLTRRAGLLVPMRTGEHRPLSEFNAVVIAFQSGDSDSQDCYPVRLRAIRGKDSVITSPARFAESRTQAEFLSRFLRLPLADTTSDHEIVVTAERAGETLQDRLRSGGPQTERVERPPAIQSEVAESGGQVTIMIRRKNSPILVALAVAVSAVMMILVAPAMWRFFSGTGTPFGVGILFLGFFILFFGILPLSAIGLSFRGGRNRIVVTASPTGIAMERRGAWRTQMIVISAAEILDVDYITFDGRLESACRHAGLAPGAPIGAGRMFAWLKRWVPSTGIVVKSRQEFVTFGEGLKPDELGFLKWVVTKALDG
jgi:hypothetical protein